MRRLPALIVLLASLAIATPARAEKFWTYESGEISDKAYTRLRFQTRASMWFATFNRPSRACDFTRALPFGSDFLRTAQNEPPVGAIGPPGPTTPCNAENSDEFGMAAGAEATFRIWGPLHVGGGVDIAYTAPDSTFIKNQLILAIPFSITLTWYPWELRPFASASITPLLYFTDDARDYTLGASGGAAYRLGEFGDLSFSVGFHSAETADIWELQLALHPIL